jgi:multicomponent K+:H+ antiporter subunit E
MIRRFVPFPALAVSLFIMWLLLAQSTSPGQMLLGALVALLGTWAMAALRPKPSVVRNWRQILLLLGIVLWDILRSNLSVAHLILSPRARPTAGFVSIELNLRNEHALAVLALIITATPGTAWVQFDRLNRTLLIHVLDRLDEEEWADVIQTRYETKLMAIFES